VGKIDAEGFSGSIDVVEVQADVAAGISADGTASASFRDQYPFDLLMPASDSLAHASLALPNEAITGFVPVKSDHPVSAALPQLRR